jgi:hypothetical protein
VLASQLAKDLGHASKMYTEKRNIFALLCAQRPDLEDLMKLSRELKKLPGKKVNSVYKHDQLHCERFILFVLVSHITDIQYYIVPSLDSLVKTMKESKESLTVGMTAVPMSTVGSWLCEGINIEATQ